MGGWRYFGPKANFPTDVVEGDLAYATDEYTLYRWNGSAWEAVLTKDFNALVNKLHAAAHESGGDDEIDVTGLHGELADPQPPKAHASTHQPGGSDALPTGTPSAITEGATGSEGSSTKLARADHVHQTPSEWTPREHGNEKHNPSFLALDGSNSPEADISWNRKGLKQAEIYDTILMPSVTQSSGCKVMFYEDNLFKANERFTVTVTPAPDSGSIAYMFDCRADTAAIWTTWNPPVVIEIDLGFAYYYSFLKWLFVAFEWGKRCSNVKIEVFDGHNDTWVTVYETSAAPSVIRVHVGKYFVKKIKYTFSGTLTYENDFRIEELGAWWLQERYGLNFTRYGGDMYGDIDMHGNDILSPGLVDGVDVSAHAARHQAGGADELTVSKLAGIEWKGVEIYSGVPSEWQTLDLSSHVGSRRALVGIRITHPGTYTKDYLAVPADWTSYPATDFEYHVGPYAARIKGGGQGALITWTDSSGRIKVWTNSAESDDKWYLEWYIALT